MVIRRFCDLADEARGMRGGDLLDGGGAVDTGVEQPAHLLVLRAEAERVDDAVVERGETTGHGYIHYRPICRH